MLLALKELKEEKGLSFKMNYERKPFFLRGRQAEIDRDMRALGLPPDAPRGESIKARVARGEFSLERINQMDSLYANAGLSPNKELLNANVQSSDTMDSQRLGRWAASISPEKGEAMWRATSKRFHEGKETEIRPIRLDSRALLMECAAEAGLDLDEAKKVLDSDVHRKEILEEVEEMHEVGIHAIPVLIFEVDGVTKGNWMADPRINLQDRRGAVDPRMVKMLSEKYPECRGREINHGSGNKADFKEMLLRLHSYSTSAANAA